MTRLRTEDIETIPDTLGEYDQRLRQVTGKTLRGIACHAQGLQDGECEEMTKAFDVCVIPMTCGQGIIPGFCEAVNAIISHLGFRSTITEETDATGMAEAFGRGVDILLFADDQRFVAVNVHRQTVSDNSDMTAHAFVAGLDLMVNGLQGRDVLVLGCGEVGHHAARQLAAMEVAVSVSDINPEAAEGLQKEIKKELNVDVRIDVDWRVPGKYRHIVDATPALNLIEGNLVTPSTYLAVPGVPCGLNPQVEGLLADRVLHDPLQLGVAAMVLDACKKTVR